MFLSANIVTFYIWFKTIGISVGLIFYIFHTAIWPFGCYWNMLTFIFLHYGKSQCSCLYITEFMIRDFRIKSKKILLFHTCFYHRDHVPAPDLENRISRIVNRYWYIFDQQYLNINNVFIYEYSLTVNMNVK